MPASGKTVPEFTTEDLQKFIIEPLMAASVIQAAGPNFLDSSQGVPVRIPSIESFGDPGWKAENEQIDDEEATSGERVLLPNTLKSVKGIARLSNELIRHSPLALLSAFQQQMTRRNAKVLDNGFLNGTAVPDGNGNHDPLGLLNQAGTQQLNTFLEAPTNSSTMLDPISTAIGLLMSAEFEDLSRVRLIINVTTFINFDKIKDADGRPVLEPDATSATGRAIKGIPVLVSSKMPTKKALLVNFGEVYVARDLSPQITILPERWADLDQTGIRCVVRQDLGVGHPEGIVELTDITV